MAKSWSFQARSSTTILHDGLDMELMTEAGQLLHRDDSTSCFNSYGSQHFQFNNKNCCGTMFHVNVLENKEQEVLEQLDGEDVHQPYAFLRGECGRRFVCTGQPIHLAAGRGLDSMVSLLLEHRADIDSTVQEGCHSGKSVLHVAVYGEGRGGRCSTLELLCQRGADLSKCTSDGLTSLHLAFQTGNVDTVRFVRSHVALEDITGSNASGYTPLEMGIKFGRMGQEQLVRAAAVNLSSLKTFIYHAAECIPMFLSASWAVWSAEIGMQLKQKDVVHLLTSHSEAAAAVLDKFTYPVHITMEEWHDQRSHVLQDMESHAFHGRDTFSAFYAKDMEWSEWHDELQTFREPPHVLKCHIPGLISPTFFSALKACGNLDIFGNVTVRAAISYVFWHGSIWVDVAQFIVSFWGLMLLMIEGRIVHEAAITEMSGAGHTDFDHAMDGVFSPSFGPERYKYGVVADWIIAKGFVDLLLEFSQFFGSWKMGDLSAYSNLGNLWDLFRSLVPLMLLCFSTSRIIHLLIVLIYWTRLLEGITYWKPMGLALLPLSKLAGGLMPPIILMLFGFFALTHAMYTIQLSPKFWPDTLWDSFSLLITQGLPEAQPEDILELVLLYGGVLFFSVFMLNIFIGVISEQYTQEKEQALAMFEAARASSCQTFLVRASLLPQLGRLCGRWTAVAVSLTCALGALLLQALALGHVFQLPGVWQLCAFLTCQLVILLSTAQCKGSSFPWIDTFETDRQLWICRSPIANRVGDSKMDKEADKLEAEKLEKLEMLERKERNQRRKERRTEIEALASSEFKSLLRLTLRETLEEMSE
ncbi:unnamed protein product, partial [Effrenium voratum]